MFIKKKIKITFGLLLTLSLLGAGLCDSNKRLSFSGGDGSQEKPFQISTAKDLENLSEFEFFNGKTTKGEYFVLINDIFITKPFDPISSFSGNLDEKGHSINNLEVLKNGNAGAGLFKQLRWASIKNLKLKNPNIVGTIYAGALAAYSKESTIENVQTIGGSVTLAQAKEKLNGPTKQLLVSAGGLIGNIHDSDIKTSSSSTSVKTDIYGNALRYIYALVGLVGRIESGLIEKSYATGDVITNPSSLVIVGALLGQARIETMVIDSYGKYKEGLKLIGKSAADTVVKNSDLKSKEGF